MERIYRILKETEPNGSVRYTPQYNDCYGESDAWRYLILESIDHGSDYQTLLWAKRCIDKNIEEQNYINKTKVEYIEYPPNQDLEDYWEICDEKFPTEDDAIDRAKQLLGKKWNKHTTLTHYWWNPEDECYESEEYSM
jgi:hypothetical protein